LARQERTCATVPAAGWNVLSTGLATEPSEEGRNGPGRLALLVLGLGAVGILFAARRSKITVATHGVSIIVLRRHWRIGNRAVVALNGMLTHRIVTKLTTNSARDLAVLSLGAWVSLAETPQRRRPSACVRSVATVNGAGALLHGGKATAFSR